MPLQTCPLPDTLASNITTNRLCPESKRHTLILHPLPVMLPRPWVKHPGPYDHTPKRPEPGQTLKYFNTQEGMQALAQDPLLAVGTHITKAGVPPPKPVQPASAGGLHLCCVAEGFSRFAGM
jgi:hypothetical protein